MYNGWEWLETLPFPDKKLSKSGYFRIINNTKVRKTECFIK